MMRLRDTPEGTREDRRRPSGFIAGRKGSRMLPDLPTAILARLRGYVAGSYPTPLTGAAAELGYHPLQSATTEELAAIQAEMDTVVGR